MSVSQQTVLRLYATVIDDVIAGVRDAFLDEGVDEQVLQELKQIWETKLQSSKAVEVTPEVVDNQTPVATKEKFMNKTNQQQNTTQQHSTATQSNASLYLQELNNKLVPIQITLPTSAGSTETQPRVLTIQVPASALQGNQLQSVLTSSVISTTMTLPQHLASTLLQHHVNTTLGQASSSVTPQQQMQQQLQQQQQELQQQRQQQLLQQQQQQLHQQNLINQANNGQVTNGQIFHQGGTGAVTQLDGQCDSSDEEDIEEEEDEDDADDDDLDDKDEDENEDNDAGAEEEPLNSGDDVSEEDPSDMFETDNVVVCQYDKITRSRNKWKFYLKDGIMNLGGKDFVFQKMNGDAEW